MKSKYLQCIFFLDVNEEEGCYVWYTDALDFRKHVQNTGCPNRVQYCGNGKIYINLALVFDLKFKTHNKFMQLSNGYDFRNPTPFTARLAR